MNYTYQQFTMTANPNNGYKPRSLSDLVGNFKMNFLQKQIQIAPGLMFNQYETIKRIYFYIHNQFISGPTDENGDPKYFYDLITYRNDQATKNIDLDTKDVYIKGNDSGSYLKTWLLRREFIGYAKTSGFGMKLNQLADDLPDFGTVVWKKIKNKQGQVDTSNVDLISIMNDPSKECLKDGMMIERHLLTQDQMRSKSVWDQDEVEDLIASGQTSSQTPYLDNAPTLSNQSSNFTANQVDQTTPYYEVYELWGEIPKSLYQELGGSNRKIALAETIEAPSVSKEGIATSMHYKQYDVSSDRIKVSTGYNDSVYVMAILATSGDQGTDGRTLFCKEVDREMFPYKEVHYRKKKGRWLGIGNYEACFDLIEKANELSNRFFSSLRLSLLHIYQTKEKTYVKNVMSDLIDGDLVVSKDTILALPTEIRGLAEYKDEMARIDAQCDRVCNSYEVVTGESLPSGTPFALGSQLLQTATKLFAYIQQNMGIFIEDVFNEWLIPDFAKAMNQEHILDLIDDAEDLDIYYDAVKKVYQYEALKLYILENSDFPDPSQLDLVGSLVADQFKKSPKQIKVLTNYFGNDKYSLKIIITGENEDKKAELATLSNVFQVIGANPAALQDPRLMKILNYILEASGFSPLDINSINQTQTNASLNPANQGGDGAGKALAPGPGNTAPVVGKAPAQATPA